MDSALGNADRDASRSETDQSDEDGPALADAPSYAEVYGDYGFTPFWGLGYITPYFPSLNPAVRLPERTTSLG